MITQPQHSYTLVMKSRLALTLCVLCLVSLGGHYPKLFSSAITQITKLLLGHILLSRVSHSVLPSFTGLEEKGFLVAYFSTTFPAEPMRQLVNNADNGDSEERERS